MSAKSGNEAPCRLQRVAGGRRFSQEEILEDFPYLDAQDIQACLAYAADRERSQLLAST